MDLNDFNTDVSDLLAARRPPGAQLTSTRPRAVEKDRTMTSITLKKTIHFEGKDYSVLEVDEPTMGGVEAYENAKTAGAGETGAMAAMLSVESGWPIEVIRKIRSSDLVKIGEALAPFGPPTPAVGISGEPSPQT